jgi:hypothetical protein
MGFELGFSASEANALTIAPLTCQIKYSFGPNGKRKYSDPFLNYQLALVNSKNVACNLQNAACKFQKCCL